MSILSFTGDDQISVEDLTDRFEELRDELTERHEDGQFVSDFEDWIDNSRDNSDPIHAAFGEDGKQVQNDIEEYYVLRELLSEMKGYGGNYKWEGDWYPDYLIHESRFADHAQQFAEDCGMVNSDAKWPNNHIDWDAAAAELKKDYTEQSVEGETYYYR